MGYSVGSHLAINLARLEGLRLWYSFVSCWGFAGEGTSWIVKSALYSKVHKFEAEGGTAIWQMEAILRGSRERGRTRRVISEHNRWMIFQCSFAFCHASSHCPPFSASNPIDASEARLNTLAIRNCKPHFLRPS